MCLGFEGCEGCFLCVPEKQGAAMTLLAWIFRLGCFALPWIYMPKWPAIAMTLLTLLANLAAAAAWTERVQRMAGFRG